MATKRLSLTGQKFGKLTVVKFVKMIKKGKATYSHWKCLCDCKKIIVVRGSSLVEKNTKSCGCLNTGGNGNSGKNKTHGMSRTKFYRIWVAMQTRCYDASHSSYKYYGAIGITVYKRWQKFENFRDDMYQSYLKHKKNNNYTSIDRINNNRNYKLSNCRWATMKEQRANQRPRQRTRDFR